jgi:uncharacterized membrane protein (DUF106 family)
LNIIDDKKLNIFSGLSKTEIEVSKVKIFTRIRSTTFLTIVIGILYYFIKNTNNIELQELLSSVIQFSIFNISYFILSIINQCYVVYFNNSFIEIHKKMNKEEKVKEEKVKEEKVKEEKVKEEEVKEEKVKEEKVKEEEVKEEKVKEEEVKEEKVKEEKVN